MTRLVAAAGAAGITLALLSACAQTVAPTAATPSAARTTAIAAVAAPSHEAVTQRVVRRILDETPALPGSRPSRRTPDSALARPMETSASPNFVSATRWWTAPGTVAGALDYLRAHPPAGMRATGHGSFGAPQVVVRDLTFDGRSTRAYRQPTLVIAVTRHGGGVAVRADAGAVWRPSRTAAEHVDPATLTTLDVTVTRPGVAPTLHRTVTGRRARALAAVVNGLPTQTPGSFGCLMDHGYVDTLVFHGGAGPDVVVRAEASGCLVAQVSVSGRPQPALAGGGVLDQALTRSLSLPPAYRR